MRVSIVTDGGVEVPAELVKKERVLLLPRGIKIGERLIKSDERNLLSEFSKGAHRTSHTALLPVDRKFLLEAYRQLHLRKKSIVSIHIFEALDNVCHHARWARQMLLPDIEMEVFEAKTADIGISFLVTKAAGFAVSRRVTPAQVCVFLKLLQDMVHTLLITSDPQNLPCFPPLGVMQSIQSRLPGMKTLLVLDKSCSAFRPLAQALTVSQLFSNRQWFQRLKQVCDVQVKHRDCEQHVQPILSQLRRTIKINTPSIRKGGPETAMLPGRFVEVVLLPSQAAIEKVERMARKEGEY